MTISNSRPASSQYAIASLLLVGPGAPTRNISGDGRGGDGDDGGGCDVESKGGGGKGDNGSRGGSVAMIAGFAVYLVLGRLFVPSTSNAPAPRGVLCAVAVVAADAVPR